MLKLTPEKMVAFCAALADTGIVRKACEAVEISRQTAYQWREDHLDFAEAWDHALKIGITALEDEAHRRAFEGTDEPVFYEGKPSGAVRKYSDTLAIFLLKAHRPSVYRDSSRVELTGAGGGPIQIDGTERAAKMAAILAAAQTRRDAKEGDDAPAPAD